MDWNLFTGLAIAIFLIRWDQDCIKLIQLLKEITILSIFVLALSTFFKTDNIPLLIFNSLPEKLAIWTGAMLFISFICVLTHRGWRIRHTQKINQNL